MLYDTSRSQREDMRAFVVFALFVSMAFAASLTVRGGKDLDMRYGSKGRKNREADPQEDIEDPKDRDRDESARINMRDQFGELRYGATKEVRESANQDGRADLRYYGY